VNDGHAIAPLGLVEIVGRDQHGRTRTGETIDQAPEVAT
jgi:hypothetical protein